MLPSVAPLHRGSTFSTDNGEPMTHSRGAAARRYRAEQFVFAFVLAGLGLIKGARILIDALDDALTLPRSTM